jgi:hypothetical protein
MSVTAQHLAIKHWAIYLDAIKKVEPTFVGVNFDLLPQAAQGCLIAAMVEIVGDDGVPQNAIGVSLMSMLMAEIEAELGVSGHTAMKSEIRRLRSIEQASTEVAAPVPVSRELSQTEMLDWNRMKEILSAKWRYPPGDSQAKKLAEQERRASMKEALAICERNLSSPVIPEPGPLRASRESTEGFEPVAPWLGPIMVAKSKICAEHCETYLHNNEKHGPYCRDLQAAINELSEDHERKIAAHLESRESTEGSDKRADTTRAFRRLQSLGWTTRHATDKTVWISPNGEEMDYAAACRTLAVAPVEAPPQGDAENVCEHGDHPAPTGKRFCSDACKRCEHESNSEIGCDRICGLTPPDPLQGDGTESAALLPDHLRGDGPCDDCGTADNIRWFIASPRWNKVVREGSDTDAIPCIPCFVKRAHAKGIDPPAWEIVAEDAEIPGPRQSTPPAPQAAKGPWSKDRPCPWCKSCGLPAMYHKEGWYVTGTDGESCKVFVPWEYPAPQADAKEGKAE